MDDATDFARSHPPVQRLDAPGLLSLRLRPLDTLALDALSLRTGLPLNGPANRIAAVLAPSAAAPPSLCGGAEVLRVGPTEWLVLSGGGDITALSALLDDVTAQVCDMTPAAAMWRIAGPVAAQVLSEACSLDFTPAAFPTGSGTRTVFAQCSAIVIRRGDSTFELIVDRAYAHYVQTWLDDAQGAGELS